MTEHIPPAADVRQERDPLDAKLLAEGRLASAALKLREMEAQAQRQPAKDVTETDAGLRVFYIPAGRSRTSDGRYWEPFMAYRQHLPWGGWTVISREQALALLEEGAA